MLVENHTLSYPIRTVFFIIFVVPVVKVVLTINLPSARSRNVKEILPSHLGVLIRFSTLSCLADIGLMELTLQMVAVFRQVFSTMSRQQVSRVTSCWGWVLFDVISLQLMYSMTRTSSFITQQLDEKQHLYKYCNLSLDQSVHIGNTAKIRRWLNKLMTTGTWQPRVQ